MSTEEISRDKLALKAKLDAAAATQTITFKQQAKAAKKRTPATPRTHNDYGEAYQPIELWDNAMQRAFKGIRTRKQRHRAIQRAAKKSA